MLCMFFRDFQSFFANKPPSFGIKTISLGLLGSGLKSFPPGVRILRRDPLKPLFRPKDKPYPLIVHREPTARPGVRNLDFMAIV